MNLVRGRCTSVGSKCVRRVWRIVRWTWREAGREKGSVWGISLERPHCIYFGGEISFIGLRLTCGPIYWGLHVRHYMLCRLNWCKFIISSTERGGTLCEVPYIKLFFWNSGDEWEQEFKDHLATCDSFAAFQMVWSENYLFLRPFSFEPNPFSFETSDQIPLQMGKIEQESMQWQY